MMPKKLSEYTNKYTVIFNAKYIRPMEEHADINCIILEIFATSIEEAISKAWKTVTLTSENYEIVSIDNECAFHPRGYNRRNYSD